MSGGHFDYGCFKISQFAEELQHDIDLNDSEELNDWGEKRGYGYSSDTVQVLQFVQVVIAAAGKMAKEAEWLYSGDTGEEMFCKNIAEIVEKSDG